MNQFLMIYKMLEGAVIDNKYYLRELLGAGGFGAVFLADEVVRDRLLRQVAVKIIPDNDNQQLIELMEATRLDHPHLIRSHTAGEWQFNNIELLYLVMERAEFSLEDRLKTGQLDVPETQKLITEVAAGLCYLHSQNKVHRDLKPGNVLWSNGSWKLSDFGLVHNLGNQSYAQTSNPIGTIAYMPPEAFGNQNKISQSWDVWSLGIMAVNAATGTLPYRFDGQTQLLQEVMNCRLNLPRVPSELEAIMQGCLRRNRRERWTAQQILGAVQLQKNIDTVPISLQKIRIFNPIAVFLIVASLIGGISGVISAINSHKSRVETTSQSSELETGESTLNSELETALSPDDLETASMENSPMETTPESSELETGESTSNPELETASSPDSLEPTSMENSPMETTPESSELEIGESTSNSELETASSPDDLETASMENSPMETTPESSGLEIGESTSNSELETASSPDSLELTSDGVESLDLSSERSGINYNRLRDLLAAGNWEEANEETAERMWDVTWRQEHRWMRGRDIERLPCKDLKIIDTLWVYYSQGEFGFSVQKKIWEELGSPTGEGEDWKRFGDRVGWRSEGSWSSRSEIYSTGLGEGTLPLGRGWVGQIGVYSLASLSRRLEDCSK
jgi:serine/threonine protein kinase